MYKKNQNLTSFALLFLITLAGLSADAFALTKPTPLESSFSSSACPNGGLMRNIQFSMPPRYTSGMIDAAAYSTCAAKGWIYANGSVHQVGFGEVYGMSILEASCHTNQCSKENR